MASRIAADEAASASDAATSDAPAPAVRFGPLRLQLPTAQSTPADVRSLLLVLSLPTFGLSFAITVLTTYGPVVLLRVAHSPAEGRAADRGRGRVRPRRAAARRRAVRPAPGHQPAREADPVHHAGRAARRAPAWSCCRSRTPSGWPGFTVLAFFIGYYLYYPPYRAIFADLLPRRLFARAQSGQAIERGAGLGVALLAGGVLLGLWMPLPFVIGGVVLVLCTLALRPIVRLEAPASEPERRREDEAAAEPPARPATCCSTTATCSCSRSRTRCGSSASPA